MGRGVYFLGLKLVKRRGHICIYFLTGLALTASVGAFASDIPSTPFREIANRNSFGLKPPVERWESPPPVSPLPKIRLAGITTILGRKIAFLIITGSEPGGLRECLVLGQGERQHEIEITDIDERAGIVKVSNGGEKQTLNFYHADDNTSNRLPVSVSSTPNSSVTPDWLSPEEQIILMEAQRVKAIQDGDPIAKILPSKELMPKPMAHY